MDQFYIYSYLLLLKQYFIKGFCLSADWDQNDAFCLKKKKDKAFSMFKPSQNPTQFTCGFRERERDESNENEPEPSDLRRALAHHDQTALHSGGRDVA
jgi:hypothetical protein